MTAMLQRKAIRMFPNDVLVGVYYSPDLDQYIVMSTGGQVNNTVNEDLMVEETLDDLGLLSEGGRFKIVRVRIRNGKIQRRKKVSNVKGYTMRGGKLKRISAKEKRNRKIGARRGKIKRRAKLKKALAKRKRSLRKLKAAGGKR